jgi:NAD(P)-dependent dehydrogenase (short-subunit alcohol dehydrogenase family)
MTARVAIITGASQGIGAGLVAGYRRAGYAVVGVALSPSSSDADDYITVAGDIADPETARRAVDQARDRFGRIDTLINNAGIYIGKPFTQYTVEDYVAITAVNLTGFFHITQLAIERMLEQRSGHVVNISASSRHRPTTLRPTRRSDHSTRWATSATWSTRSCTSSAPALSRVRRCMSMAARRREASPTRETHR